MAVAKKTQAKTNLKPPRSSDEARELGKKGGLASGVVRRKKRTMRERLEVLLSMPSDINPKDDNADTICVALIKKASNGDVSAFTAIRDSIGEKPTDKIDSTSSDGSMTPIITLSPEMQALIDKVAGR